MRVKIEKLDHFGRGICYIDGKICFVEDTLPGEDVKIKITLEKKKYMLGRVKDFYSVSSARVDELCPYKDKCGGCDLSHLSYKMENEYKCLKVKEILKKYADVDEVLVEDVSFGEEYNYRNKITLHGDHNIIGYYKKNSNDIVPINKCLLVDEKINHIINVINMMSSDNEYKDIIIRVSNDSEEVLISITGKVKGYEVLEDLCDSLIINDEVVKGERCIMSFIGEKKFIISDKGFFQVNKTLTERLYNEVLNIVKEVKPKKVLDLYCGCGTIGIYISDYVDEVVGVEVFKESIENAKKNKKLNNCHNIRFICDKVENVIDNIKDNTDLVIVDPPRGGLDKTSIDVLLSMNVNNLVYVSCDPVTLARDIKLLKEKYDVVSIKPFNMFSKTYHVECVCLLKAK